MKLTYRQQKEVQRVNAAFDRQSVRDSIYQAHKALFNYSIELTREDWAAIRTPNYWNVHDRIEKPNDRILFTLTEVENYLNN
jgi:hypothetical protein